MILCVVMIYFLFLSNNCRKQYHIIYYLCLLVNIRNMLNLLHFLLVDYEITSDQLPVDSSVGRALHRYRRSQFESV